MKNEFFSHLHLHSCFSRLDGYGDPSQIAKRAKEMGFKAIAITDHGNVDGAIKFQQACLKEGIIPIIGCELYIVPNATKKDKGEKKGHLITLVKNETGWINLLKMLSYANLTGFYNKPRVDYQTFLDHHEGLIVTTACMSSFLRLESGVVFANKLLEAKNGEDFYLEFQPHNIDWQREYHDFIFSLNFKRDIPFIATNDCHYILGEEALTQEILLAINQGKKWTDESRWKFDVKSFFLRSADEMLEEFRLQGQLDKNFCLEALRRTQDIVEACKDFRIKKQDINLPDIGIEKENKYLYNLCREGKKKIPNWNEEYQARLDYEFDILERKKFITYFLLVHDLIQWCRKNDIMVGPGRGSVGSSLIAYLIDITNIDPIKYNIPFARFINEERIDYPDIDIDFEDRKRDKVKKRLFELYGENNVAGITTFQKLKARAVLRDVGRVFDVPLKEVDVAAKSISDSIDDISESFKKKYPLVYKQSKKIEGQIKSLGRHAAGLVVSMEDLRNGTRGYLSIRDGNMMINWDGPDCEYVGLMKLDILGLNTLSVLSETKRLIEEHTGKSFVYETIPLDDPAILKDISAGATVGAFQINTYAMTSLIKEMGVECFEHISDANALVRPGPMNSGMTKHYIERKHGEKWEPLHPIYEEVTKRTYGLVVYQEDVMNVVHKVAGLPYPTADKVRKIMAKKQDPVEMEKYRDQFVEGCLKMETMDSEHANVLWDEMVSFAGYGFNIAHSLEYSMIGFWTMWVKHYYPTEFICASLSYGAEDNMVPLIKEARRIGLEIFPPKVGISKPKDWAVKENKLFAPFFSIKGIGDVLADEIYEETKPTKGVGFWRKQSHKGLRANAKKILIEIDAFNPNTKLPKGAEHYFDFDVNDNIRERYPKLISLIGNKSQKIELIERALVGNVEDLDLHSDCIPAFKRPWYELLKCEKCELKKECKRPVCPSPSFNNVMIVGEAPGKDENEAGKGFIGPAGDKLWKELKKYGLERDMFHITNVAKCYPGKRIKTPQKDHIIACSNWLDEEIEYVKPFGILALGNVCLNRFKGLDKGIRDKSGTTDWDEKYGCWICWSVHPSSVLRSNANLAAFEAGIRNFSEFLEKVGGV